MAAADMIAMQDDIRTVTLDYVDPLAEQAVTLIANRSNAGAVRFGNPSILNRADLTAKNMIEEAIEESADQLMYLLAVRALLDK